MGLDGIANRITLKFRMNSKSIQQLMVPITINGWLTGRGIVEFPLGEPWPVTSCLYSVLLILGFCVTSKVTLDNIELIVLSKSAIGSLVLTIAIYFNSCIVICNSLNGWKSMKSVKTIINRLEASGRKMEKIGIPQDYKRVHRCQTIAVIGEILYVIGIAIASDNVPLDVESLWLEVNVIVALHYPLIVLSIGDTTFITLVRYVVPKGTWQELDINSLNLRFEQLNKMLKNMSAATNDSPQHQRVLERTILNRHNVGDPFEKRTNDNANVMRIALEDHHELVIIGSLINEAFGTQALLSITFAFYYLVGLLYRATSLLLWSTLETKIVGYEVVSIFGWMVFVGYKIITLTCSCAKAAYECKATAGIICHLHEPSTSKAFRDEISDFLLQMAQHIVKFTACGLFTLDYGLIHGMIGSISTYFVILLQIGDTSTSTLLATSETPPAKAQWDS